MSNKKLKDETLGSLIYKLFLYFCIGTIAIKAFVLMVSVIIYYFAGGR